MRVRTWLGALAVACACAAAVTWLVRSGRADLGAPERTPATPVAPLGPSAALSLPSEAAPGASADSDPAPTTPGYAPTGAGVALDAALELRSALPLSRPSVEASLKLAPPAEGRWEWSEDDRLARFLPVAWEAGRSYAVEVVPQSRDGRTLGELRWEFRSEVPAPEQIVQGNGGNVVFTFDDGPRDFDKVERLLELLARRRVRAIFFPTAHSLKKRPDWIARVRRAGHQVCNHTYSHTDLAQANLKESAMRREIETGAAHGQCHLLRPPGMAWDARTQRVARELGYELFLWDVDSRDWEGAPREEIEHRILRGVRPGAVLLFHMQGEHTLAAVSRIARRLTRAGYVLSWDPADLPDPSRYRVGLEQTWLGSPEAAGRFQVTGPARWPFDVPAAVPYWAERLRLAHAADAGAAVR